MSFYLIEIGDVPPQEADRVGQMQRMMYAICEEAVSRYTNEKDNYAKSCNFDQIFGKLGSDWGPLGDRWVM